MSLRSIINELVVTDITKALEFYQDILNFEIEWTDGEPIHWIQLTRDGHKLMLEDHKVVSREIKNFPQKKESSNLLKFEYDNLEELKEIYENCQRKLINFFIDYQETDYGKIEFGILDPDKNKIIVSYLK